MKYRARYKCRMCGEIYESGAETGNRQTAWSGVVRIRGVEVPPDPGPMAPDLFGDHNCPDGHIGLSDYWGERAYEDQDA